MFGGFAFSLDIAVKIFFVAWPGLEEADCLDLVYDAGGGGSIGFDELLGLSLFLPDGLTLFLPDGLTLFLPVGLTLFLPVGITLFLPGGLTERHFLPEGVGRFVLAHMGSTLEEPVAPFTESATEGLMRFVRFLCL